MNDRPTPDEAQGPEFARLLDALRGPAQPDELAGREVAVDAMAQAIAEVRGITQMKPTLRRRKVAVMIAAGVLGVGGVAAAGAGSFTPSLPPAAPFDSVPATDPPTTDAPTTDPPTTDATEPTDPPTTDAPEPTDPPTTDAPEPTDPPTTDGPVTTDEPEPPTSVECQDGNHGETVSSVAHEVEPGPGHGEAVSEAARSDCGKDGDEADDDGDEQDDEQDDDEQDEGDHGRSGDDHGQSGDDHGQSGEDHGQSGDDHGQSGDDHGNGNG